MDKDKLLQKIQEEVEFAKSTFMPHFVLGLMQAKKIIEEQEE
jgi:hypothetical protein